MTVFSIQQAKANWSALIAEVEHDGEVVITRYGKPVAKMIAIEAEKVVPGPRKPSRLWNGEGE